MSEARKDREAGQQAADWVARRDRGLSASEQDDYLQWLSENPRHAAMIARHEGTLRLLRRLQHWQPDGSSEPNPDLFARPRGRWRRWALAVSAGGALAAALVIGGFLREPVVKTIVPPAPVSSFLRHNERQVLTDGSMVELRDGSRIEVQFTPQERRVRLTGGEAHFTVAKNPAWPFVVEAGRVAVRAIGTAFAVRYDPTEIDVVVTEGRVRLESSGAPGAALATLDTPEIPASHRVLVSLTPSAPAPVITPVTTDQMRDALAWQVPRFQFFETPLAEAVAEFNRRNPQQVVIGDPELAAVPIGGTFRADNVDGFVSLLELSLGVRAERQGKGSYVLTRGR